MTDVILETRGLTKEFKGFVAVRDVSLKVRRGSIHALIGPNGAGKTTCFNLLTHFLDPTRGSIFFNGREITGSKPSSIARMGSIPSITRLGLVTVSAVGMAGPDRIGDARMLLGRGTP